MPEGVPALPWSLTTLFSPTAPEEAPTILSITPHTTTSVLIRWQVLSPPPCPALGGDTSGCQGSEQPLSAFPLSLPLQPPAEDKINGILLGFRLRYRELVYDSLRGFALRGHPGATWAELTRESPRPYRPWGQRLGWPGGGQWGSEQCSILCSTASRR